MTIHILSLHSYPVKSCAGVDHEQALAGVGGLPMDRHWVVVDRYGIFMTQRQYARMALIRPSFPDGFDGPLVLSAPGMADLTVAPAGTGAMPQPVPVRIWGADTLGADEGDPPAQWLSEFLGTPCRLLREHPAARRLASPERVQGWRERYGSQAPELPRDHPFAFADGFPYLVTSQASLDDLNRRLTALGASAVAMTRFRPSIVIGGLDAFEEDYLSSMQAGPLVFAFVKRCARCPIPDIDPVTALSSPETGLVLAQYRQFEEGVLFGVNAVMSGPDGGALLKPGDEVKVEYSI